MRVFGGFSLASGFSGLNHRAHATADGDDELEAEVEKVVVSALAAKHQTLIGLYQSQGSDLKRWVAVPAKYRDTAEWRLCLKGLLRVTEGQGPAASPSLSRAIRMGTNDHGLVVCPSKRFSGSDRLKQRIMGGLRALTGLGYIELSHADAGEQANDDHAYQTFYEGEAARIAGRWCERLGGGHPLSVR